MSERPLHTPTHLYAGPYLDRGGERRKDPDWVAAAFDATRARFVPVWQALNLVTATTEPRAVLYSRAEAEAWLAHAAPIYLGDFRGQACFALELHGTEAPDEAHRFIDLRLTGATLDSAEAGLLAYARALVYWRSRHRHCGACGAPAKAAEGGQVMVCTNDVCGQQSFPRLDPAIIVLVSNGEQALLGRQATWPAGRYSTLAGFVEPGESLEDAVVREVAEEANVAVREVRYHSSQPWPFPSSLMIGFEAGAAPGSTPVAGDELEDARWVSRDDIARGEIRVPPLGSISFRLIEAWYDGEPGRSLASDLAAGGRRW